MKNFKLAMASLAALLVVALAPVMSLSKGTEKDTVVLTSDNTIVLNDEVSGESVGEVISKAKKLNKGFSVSNKPIYLVLNTPGGSIQAGLELVEALKGMKRPVNTVTQFAASMGFQIAQNLEERLILQSGVLMSHHAKGGFEGEFGGESSQVESRLRLWTSRVNELDQITADRTKGKQTLQSYQRAYTPELWRTGGESVKDGYADKVVKVACDDSLQGVSTKEIMFMGIIPVKYDIDNCPLNTSPMNVRVGIFTNQGQMDSDAFLKKDGEFGASCLIYADKSPVKKLCALDTSLTLSKVKEMKNEFVNAYSDMKSRSEKVFKARKAGITDYWGI